MSRCGCRTNCLPPTPVECEQVCTAFYVSNSWNVPNCGSQAIWQIPGLANILIGSFLYNPTYGWFEVTYFDSLSSQVTVKNNCYGGNAEPGTPVPAGTEFVLGSPPVQTTYQTWAPVITGSGTIAISAQLNRTVDYFIIDQTCWFDFYASFTLAGSGLVIYVPAPVEAVPFASSDTAFACRALGSATTGLAAWGIDLGTPLVFSVRQPDGTNWGAGAKAIGIQGKFRIAV